ncbi:LuxR C-terminal-related transcriptional regulator [Micromonospora sp. KC213]|uniref:helix-turn-helix transcriptional regulator n=1 Tax=Micromonospora sp. KC213 TaxID=2530378 RepID=UPI001A9E08B1|nr:LuxR C-terminal-related transcriptional regulator [Micromonospora sp. KC213]
MTMTAGTERPLLLRREQRTLLDRIAADPAAPLVLGVTGVGGHGKTALLAELTRLHRQAGQTVVTTVDDETPAHPDAVLIVDDAHLLDDARLATLRRLAETDRHRLVVAYRPWPRRAALTELADTLRRHGEPVLLTPLTADQTAARLGAGTEPGLRSGLADFVHGQSAGVPRDVDRLARALRGTRQPPTEPPQPAVLEFGPDLDRLPPAARRLLLALAGGVPLPVDLLAALLDQTPEAVADLVGTTRAAGLLTAEHRITPLVRHAVLTLSPPADRTAVWRRLIDLRLARGGAMLPLIRSSHATGTLGDCPAPALRAAAEEALAEEPALAAELFATATATGGGADGRQATAAALAGDLDTALRLADRLLATAAPADRVEAATVAATALAHRGQVARSVELYRWSGTAPASAFATVGALATGQRDDPPGTGGSTAAAPPTLLAGAARLMAEGVRESIDGSPTAALSALMQAAALLEPDGRTVLLPDSPAALAALTAVHCAELDIAERVLDRATASRTGGPLLARRHRLLRAWILMLRGNTGAAAEAVTAMTAEGAPLESRDLLFATGLRMGVARRNSDLGELQRGWGHALEAVLRHPVDLFTLLPLGELAIAAARLGDLDRLEPHLHQARRLLDDLDGPALWSAPLHWCGLHAAILADRPATADDHVAALVAAADHSRYAAVVASAAVSWLEVLRGTIDPVRVETAARGLYDAGLRWDAARLAGQAAIRTSDRRAMSALLDSARMFQGRPGGTRGGPRSTAEEPAVAAEPPVDATPRHQLSEREHEVAELVLAGLTYREIGDRLFISAKTVEHHVARMRSRLHCASRAELLALLRTLVAERVSASTAAAWPERTTS